MIRNILTHFFGTLINVTEDDIKQGEKMSSTNCPLAIAIQKLLDNKYGQKKKALVNVDHVATYTQGFNHRRVVPLPIEAREFIRAFDSDNEVKPFSFKLYI
jgi:hypothetical protein